MFHFFLHFHVHLYQHGEVGQKTSVMIIDRQLYALWSLLPSFCNYPLDTAESFKDLEKALCLSLREEPNHRGLICSSLQILIEQNKRVLDGENETSGKEVSLCEQRAISRYTSEVAASNLDVLKSSARDFLSRLSGVFIKSSKDDGGALQVLLCHFLKPILSEILIVCDLIDEISIL